MLLRSGQHTRALIVADDDLLDCIELVVQSANPPLQQCQAMLTMSIVREEHKITMSRQHFERDLTCSQVLNKGLIGASKVDLKLCLAQCLLSTIV